MAVTIAKVQSPLTSMDDKEEALSQLWGQIKIHSYSADKAAQKYDVQIGNDKTGFGFSYTKSEVTGHYGSATTENPNPDITRADIKDTEKKGEVNLTLGGKPYKLRATVQTSEDVTGGQKDPTPITRFAGQVVIPISVFKDVYKSKTLNSIPPDVWKSMVAVFKEMNPSIALGPSELSKFLAEGITAAMKSSPKVMAAMMAGADKAPDVSGTTVSSNTSIAIGVECYNLTEGTPPKLTTPKWNVTLSLESESKVSVDAPIGAAGYLNVTGKVDFEVGIRFPLPDKAQKALNASIGGQL